MAASRRFASSRWIYGALLAGLATGAGYVAHEQGWFDSFARRNHARPDRHQSARKETTVPAPDEPDEFGLSASLLLSQIEPEESDADRAEFDSPIMTVGFEE